MDYNILFNLANFVNADNVGKSQMFPVQCLHGIHNILEMMIIKIMPLHISHTTL